MLSVEHLTRRFGGVVALDDVSFDVPDGQILGLIGPNGAGKTTAFNVITRLYKPDSGRVVYDGENLLKVAPYDIVRRGIARTFQNVELFSRMSVLENVLVGAHSTTDWFREEDGRARALEALELTGIADLAPRVAASLPYATLKRIELARALVSKPRLLLLDEPAGGLSHEEVHEFGDFLLRIKAGAPPDRAPRRAPHGPRHASLPDDPRARLREADRERHAGRGAGAPGRDRGLPWHRRGRRGGR